MKQQVNLYQAELRPQRVIYPAVQMLAVIGVAVVAIAIFYGVRWYEVNAMRAQVTAAEQRVTSAESRVESMRGQFPPPVVDDALTTRLERRRGVLRHTREIADALSSGVYGRVDGLSGFLQGLARQHVEGTWLTGIRIERGGVDVALSGKSLYPELVAEYLQRLSGEQIFSGKSFTTMKLEVNEETGAEIDFSVRSAGIQGGDES